MSRDAATTLIEEALRQGRRSLSEHESKQVLSAYGIAVTVEALVKDREELAAALPGFTFPVVLKIDSPDILHKTEAGLVALDCRTPEQAHAEFERLLSTAAAGFPQARISGVLVQEKIVGAVAECIVGMKKDPQFGPTVMFGLGGIFVEVFEDVALRVTPLTLDDARDMVRQTKGFKILSGARGRPKADIAAIEDLLVKMSALSLDLEPYVSEIDLNPVMVGTEGAWEGRTAVAVDALILLDAAPGGAGGAL